MSKEELTLEEIARVPGVTIVDGFPYGVLGGKMFPVLGVLRAPGGGYVPVLDIPQMEEKPARMTTEAAV